MLKHSNPLPCCYNGVGFYCMHLCTTRQGGGQPFFTWLDFNAHWYVLDKKKVHDFDKNVDLKKKIYNEMNEEK